MPRQLKTYVTTSGFFELAVAAPTMKAALDIWGTGPDLFRRGYAKETKDAAIAKATIAKPGDSAAEGGRFKRRLAQLYAAAQKKRERDSARAEAAERKVRERRERAIKKAEVAIQEARAVHDEQVLAIAADRDALEQKARDEDARWERQKRLLEAALRDARA